MRPLSILASLINGSIGGLCYLQVGIYSTSVCGNEESVVRLDQAGLPAGQRAGHSILSSSATGLDSLEPRTQCAFCWTRVQCSTVIPEVFDHIRKSPEAAATP